MIYCRSPSLGCVMCATLGSSKRALVWSGPTCVSPKISSGGNQVALGLYISGPQHNPAPPCPLPLPVAATRRPQVDESSPTARLERLPTALVDFSSSYYGCQRLSWVPTTVTDVNGYCRCQRLLRTLTNGCDDCQRLFWPPQGS